MDVLRGPEPTRSPRRISIWRSVGAVAVVLLVLLVSAIGSLVLATSKFDQAAHYSARLSTTQDAVDAAARAVDRMETRLHGFLTTGAGADRRAWRSANQDLATAVGRVRRLAPESDPATHRIVTAARTYASGLGERLVERRAASPMPAGEIAQALNADQRHAAGLRQLLDRVEVGAQREATAALGGAAATAHRYRAAGIASLVAALAALFLVGVLVSRGVLRPLRGLRQMTERLAAGAAPLAFDGPMSRELSDVSTAVMEVARRDRLLVSDLETARLEVLEMLARATEFRDDDTHEHTERVGTLAACLGAAVGLDHEQVARLRLAAPLHDVGKIGIPDSILLKPGRLTPDERRQMQQHTTFGSQMLSGSPSPVLQMAQEIALSHHERWDGEGYPLGLSASAIPLPARIVAVADVFDALTHDRPYKSAWNVEQAVSEIARQSGRQFDPQVVDAFLALPDDVLGEAATQPLDDLGAVAQGSRGTTAS